MNVGDTSTKGLEAEAGWRVNPQWRLYSSLTYTQSTIKQNLQVGATQFEPNAGKDLPDTPRWLAGFSAQYSSGPWVAGTQIKYTGRRYSTLVNDESDGGYTLTDVNVAYKFGTSWMFKNPTLKFNVHNVFNTRYLALNSGSGSLFTNRAQPITGLPAAAAPAYYTGAPRFASMTFTSDF